MALQVFSGKVTPEVAEQFKAAQENSEAQTFNAFMELLLEAYLNPKTKPVEVARPTADQLQEIQLKENEIGRLKSAYSIIEANNQELQAEIMQLTAQNSELATRNAQLETQPAPRNPEPGTIELTIPPIMSIVLDIEKEVAERKTGKKFSDGDILLNNFWESIYKGVSYPFRIWSRGELSDLAKQIKEIEPQQ